MRYQKVMLRIFLFSISLLLLNSCSISKTTRVIESGSIRKNDFYKEVDFNFTKGLLIVDIEINGKIYPFIFDTGASVSVIEEDLAKELNCKKILTKNIGDSAGKKKKYDFVTIPTFEIESLQFQDFSAAVSDFSDIANFFACDTKVYGILGNNIFRKAYWRIDYQKEKIWFGNNIADFSGIEKDTKIKLSLGRIGNAYIETTLDSITAKFTFDTGKRGKIKGNGNIFKKVLEKNKGLEYTPNKGLTGISLNGKNYGIVNHTLIKKVSFGGIELNDQIIELDESPAASRLLGNEIWENYILTIDWTEGYLYLRPNQEMIQEPFEKFEHLVLADYKTKSLKLSNKWLEHPTAFDIDPDNKIVSIEGIDVKNLNESAYCEFVNNGLPEIQKKQQIELKVLEKGQVKNITLRKAELISIK